ncbi:glycine amidinotransferase [Moorena producens JHB]|uniref:Glycine amidinotransferase n=1 Tax=Moorena producens (strain JHB) TaxID=1454205 RepID=A0A1D9G0N3_MOOP1|nr:glycine amidinotransferase [Moorena producens]AOY81163.1 glycine amidinotransferase [Moorena producens JHB]
MVNSFDEWSPLKEVIVGSPINYNIHDLELSFKLFFHENVDLEFFNPRYGKKDQGSEGDLTLKQPKTHQLKNKYLEELTEDVDELVKTLEKLEIKVHRPTSLNKAIDIKTPYWEATCIPALNPRDRAIIFGDEILETSPMVRARYFENDLLKPIFYQYFKAGARWTNMPMPMMTDRSFDLSYVDYIGQDMYSSQTLYQQEPSEFDVGYEIMIDGAQCLRFGKDVLVNVATKNHELGLQWLERHLGDRFRLHRLYRLTDNHIDSYILPLRPGTLLLRNPDVLKVLPEPLQKWDVIYPPEPTENLFPAYEDDDLILTSKYIDLNVLSIDQEKVIVNSLNPNFIKTLEQHGFTPIPVRHRHRRLFAGGFHCFTLDTVRAGSTCEDYFN